MKKASYMRILFVIPMMMIAMTAPVFADVTNAGENLGTWITEQAWWVALAIIAVMIVKFIIKKAWVQCVVFAVIGGVALVFIKTPESLFSVGDSLWNIISR